MRYFLDTEFYERGPTMPILPISLALVCEDGRELYIENENTNPTEWSVWLRENVAPWLTGPKVSMWDWGAEILRFVGKDKRPEFWAYFAAYDWVIFCQAFTGLMHLPEAFPQHCLDLQQELYLKRIPKPVIEEPGPQHHALRDARWNKALYEYIQKKVSNGSA